MISLNKYYKVLNIPENATKEEIKNAYKKLAKKWHPDNFINDIIQQNLATQKFIDISEAYQILLNRNDNLASRDENSVIEINDKKDIEKYYYNLGILATENEEWEEAIYYFNSAINLNNNFAEAYFYRATVLEKQGFNLRAEADYNKFNQLKGKVNKNKSPKININNKKSSFRRVSIKNKVNIKKNNSILKFSIGVILCLLLIPLTYSIFKNIRFMNLFKKYAEKSLTQKDLLPTMQQTFDYYGGDVQAIETAKKFCQFMKENYPISSNLSFIEQDLKSDKGKYIMFTTENASQVADFFSNGDISNISNTLKGNIKQNSHHGIEAIAWGITFASVKVYCPEYKSIFFIEQ